MKRISVFVLLLWLPWLGGSATALAEDYISSVRCMAANMYHEARGENISGMELVGNVVYNRMRSGRFPDTACAVITQPMQFSWYNKNKSMVVEPPDALSETDYQIAVYLAERILSFGYVLKDPTGGALFYYRTSIDQPEWAEKMPVTFEYKNHIFHSLVL